MIKQATVANLELMKKNFTRIHGEPLTISNLSLSTIKFISVSQMRQKFSQQFTLRTSQWCASTASYCLDESPKKQFSLLKTYLNWLSPRIEMEIRCVNYSLIIRISPLRMRRWKSSCKKRKTRRKRPQRRSLWWKSKTSISWIRYTKRRKYSPSRPHRCAKLISLSKMKS